MRKIINYFGGEKRFYTIMIVLIIMWIGFMIFFWVQGDNVSKDPCGICAKRMGEDVICYTQGVPQLKRTYTPNNTIFEEVVGENLMPSLK